MAGPLAIPAWGPTLDDVGAEIRTRTLKLAQQRSGAEGEQIETGSFSSLTRVDSDEATRMVVTVCNEVRAAAGLRLPVFDEDEMEEGVTVVYDLMRSCATLGAAAAIERSGQPEQVQVDRGPYQALKDDYERMLKAVEKAAGALDLDNDTDDPADDAGLAHSTTNCGPYAAEMRW